MRSALPSLEASCNDSTKYTFYWSPLRVVVSFPTRMPEAWIGEKSPVQKMFKSGV